MRLRYARHKSSLSRQACFEYREWVDLTHWPSIDWRIDGIAWAAGFVSNYCIGTKNRTIYITRGHDRSLISQKQPILTAHVPGDVVHDRQQPGAGPWHWAAPWLVPSGEASCVRIPQRCASQSPAVRRLAAAASAQAQGQSCSIGPAPVCTQTVNRQHVPKGRATCTAVCLSLVGCRHGRVQFLLLAHFWSLSNRCLKQLKQVDRQINSHSTKEAGPPLSADIDADTSSTES